MIVRSEGAFESKIGWRLGMPIQRGRSRSCWFVLDFEGGGFDAWGTVRCKLELVGARVERVQKCVRSSSRAGYLRLSESKYRT